MFSVVYRDKYALRRIQNCTKLHLKAGKSSRSFDNDLPFENIQIALNGKNAGGLSRYVLSKKLPFFPRHRGNAPPFVRQCQSLQRKALPVQIINPPWPSLDAWRIHQRRFPISIRSTQFVQTADTTAVCSANSGNACCKPCITPRSSASPFRRPISGYPGYPVLPMSSASR